MELKLYSAAGDNYLPEQFVKVNLTSEPSALFAPGTQIFPAAAGGLDLLFNPSDFKAFQQAGRLLAGAGVFKVNLSGVKISKREALFFLQGLYDGRNSLQVVFELDDAALFEIEQQANLLFALRYLAGTSSKVSTPLSLIERLTLLCAQTAEQCAAGQVTGRIIKRGDAEFEHCAGLRAVGSGSVNDPAMGIIDFIPAGLTDSAPLDFALVGKGITFDSGGYDLKPSKFMSTMRTDKCGAVYMAGTLAFAILNGLKRRVRCYLPCSENLVSGSSMLPGDIISYPNGVSVEINNTDAEGRLVLADGLLQAQQDGARFIIDAATLTGAAKVAVGRDITAYFASDKLASELQLEELFAENEEELWRLPLRPYFKRFLKSERACMTNSGHGDGAPGASVAAAFLQSFVSPELPWLHFDLSSAYMAESSPFYASAQATAAGVYSLAQFLCQQ